MCLLFVMAMIFKCCFRLVKICLSHNKLKTLETESDIVTVLKFQTLVVAACQKRRQTVQIQIILLLKKQSDQGFFLLATLATIL